MLARCIPIVSSSPLLAVRVRRRVLRICEGWWLVCIDALLIVDMTGGWHVQICTAQVVLVVPNTSPATHLNHHRHSRFVSGPDPLSAHWPFVDIEWAPGRPKRTVMPQNSRSLLILETFRCSATVSSRTYLVS